MSSNFIPAIKISCSYAKHQDMHLISHLLSAQDNNCCYVPRLNLCSLLVILHSQNNLLFLGGTLKHFPLTPSFCLLLSLLLQQCYSSNQLSLFTVYYSSLTGHAHSSIEIALVRVTNAFQVEKSNSHTSLLTLTSHLAQLITTFIDTFPLVVLLQIQNFLEFFYIVLFSPYWFSLPLDIFY